MHQIRLRFLVWKLVAHAQHLLDNERVLVRRVGALHGTNKGEDESVIHVVESRILIHEFITKTTSNSANRDQMETIQRRVYGVGIGGYVAKDVDGRSCTSIRTPMVFSTQNGKMRTCEFESR